MSGLSRRAFLATGAATATGAALAAAPHIAAGLGANGASTGQTAGREPAGVEVEPSGVAPREPIIAYVRDEERGEVTGRAAPRDDLPRPGARQADPRGRRPECPEQRRWSSMSSHREAPEISQDPVADNTDKYAFVSPDDPTRSRSSATTSRCRTLPADPTCSSSATTSCTRSTSTTTATRPGDLLHVPVRVTDANPNTFLYNTGPITSLDSPNWNKRQIYTVTRVDGKDATAGDRPREGGASAHTEKAARGAKLHQALGNGLACPPCNIGPRSTPNYAALAGRHAQASSGGRCSPDSAQDGFFVDLGAIFDLADLRPFQKRI